MADDIVARLRDWKKAADGTGFGSLLGIFDEAADEIERLRAERDEARRLICDLSWEDSKEVARQLGWDCFKEKQ